MVSEALLLEGKPRSYRESSTVLVSTSHYISCARVTGLYVLNCSVSQHLADTLLAEILANTNVSR